MDRISDSGSDDKGSNPFGVTKKYYTSSNIIVFNFYVNLKSVKLL